MIRVRTLATTCARECVRSATAAGQSAGRGGAARATVVARAFSESSLPSAQPPFDTAANAGPVHAEDPGAFPPGQQQHGSEEKVEDVGELLRRQTQAREDWTQPVEMSEYEKIALSKDLVRRIRGLRQAPKSTRVGVAIETLDEGRRKGIANLMTYKGILKLLLGTYGAGESASENLVAILDRMREDGLEADVKTYNLILDFHASVHAPEKAVEVYEEMISRGLQPDQKTASHMIVAHSRGHHDAMYRAVEEMYSKGWQGSRAAYLSMIAVMGKRHDYDGVLYTFRRMREESKKPTEAACFWAFRAAENLEQVETAKQVFEHRIEVGLPPQEYAYVKMMVLLLKDGHADESLDYWRQLVCVNGLNDVAISPETYNLAIKCATRADDLGEMEAVVEMMEAQGIVPTEGTYVAALAGFERPPGREGPHMEEVERAFARIAKTGPPIGTSLRQRQAVGYAHAGMWQKAYDLFQPVLAGKAQLSARDWKCLMMSQFELGKHAEVKATWIISTEGRNTSHSYKSFECALKAASKLEDADWALQLREAAKRGGKESVDLDQAAVDVLVKAGRLEEARAVLKEWEAVALRGPKVGVFQEAYEAALAACEEKGDTQLALRFLDGMRSATPPYNPKASSPSFVFLLRALKDNGRADEVQAFFDDVCATQESTGEDGGAISPECFTVLLEAEARCHGPETSLEPAACSESTEAGIETGFGEEDGADVGPPQDSEGSEAGEGEASSPKPGVV